MNLKKPDIFLIILAIALLVGMILTGVIGKGKSKHGYGFIKLDNRTLEIGALEHSSKLHVSNV
jgi:hypothetical protein